MHVCPCITPVALSLESYANPGRGAATKSPAGASKPSQSQKMNSLKMRSQMGALEWSLHHPAKVLPVLNHHPAKVLPVLNHLLLCPLVRSSPPCVVSRLCLACGHLVRTCLPCVLSLVGIVPRVLLRYVCLLALPLHCFCCSWS